MNIKLQPFVGGKYEAEVHILGKDSPTFTVSVTTTAMGQWGFMEDDTLTVIDRMAKGIVSTHHNGAPYKAKYSFDSTFKSLPEVIDWISRQ